MLIINNAILIIQKQKQNKGVEIWNELPKGLSTDERTNNKKRVFLTCLITKRHWKIPPKEACTEQIHYVLYNICMDTKLSVTKYIKYSIFSIVITPKYANPQ